MTTQGSNATERDPLGKILDATLADAFGYRSFRPNQEEIVRAILQGRDVFAVMPTGGGKSLCYQLPAIVAQGLCVVVSPLLSLMKDQVDAAVQNGINAATINSTTSAGEYREIVDMLAMGRLDLLYISPERLNTKFKEVLKEARVSFFAIDEAHCISQWGHNFRADYLELGQIVEDFPGCPVAAFTATATEQVGADIVNSLKLRDPFRVVASFDRPNLFYQIEVKDNAHSQLLAFLKEMPGESGIVYRASRKKVEETAEFLASHGYKAEAYHAGMPDGERARVQERFSRDETPIVVATIAFGMGIDKSNVRFVVHCDLPKDVESYYQETGRAGRDGAPSRCLLLFNYGDIKIQRSFLKDYEDETARRAAEQRLNEMVRYAETDGCRRANLLAYFGEKYQPKTLDGEPREPSEGCGSCDYCVGICKRVDATVDAMKALSAMVRTDNRFGMTHIIDIVTGNLTEKVQRFRHDQLKTFGVGADRPKQYWRRLIQALVTQGLAQTGGDPKYPILQITPTGWEVLRQQRKVEIVDRPDKKTRSENARKLSNALEKDQLRGQDRVLFEKLRNLRYELANAEGTKPYLIFNDRALIDMAVSKPRDEEEFLDISGVGKRKLEDYGSYFLEAIAEFLDD